MPQLVQPLFDGPVDIVGDVHGEIGALDTLLERLGYSSDGHHADGRQLVFVGDLVDRGPDSPAVVERVADMVVAGRAQCVLGNHELNLLVGDAKEGNGWFYPRAEDHDLAQGIYAHTTRASDSQRAAFQAWFQTLPLALERPDLRVVHACWHNDHVDALRDDPRPIVDIHADDTARIDAALASDGHQAAAARELEQWREALGERNTQVPLLPAVAEIGSRRQSGQPLKVLTSGLEKPTTEPFFVGGKWRMVERLIWWHDYSDAPAVVFGHYWRWPFSAAEAAEHHRGPYPFAGSEPFDWLGPRNNAMCIDWCVGARWLERERGVSKSRVKLGALRADTGAVVLDR